TRVDQQLAHLRLHERRVARIDLEVAGRATVLLELPQHAPQRMDETIEAARGLGERAERIRLLRKAALERARDRVIGARMRVCLGRKLEAGAQAELNGVALYDAGGEAVKGAEARMR